MFPELPSFSADEAFLFALGRAGGLCDCRTEEDDDGSLGSEAAGWPFFGQFIAHDITADRSTIRHHVDAAALTNARTPQLNLECLYGDGPIGQPFLFRRDDAAKLLLSRDANDVQRNAEGTAIIGDPRNDSHVFMSQMHLGFARAHNGFVDAARLRGVADADVFTNAARELRWHYQRAVLEEFLPALIGSEMTRQIVVGDRRYYRPEVAFNPARVRGCGVSLRTRADPTSLSSSERCGGRAGVSRPAGISARRATPSGRLDACLRCAWICAGAASQEAGRTTRGIVDFPAGGNHRRV